MQAIRIRFTRGRNGNSRMAAKCYAGSFRKAASYGKSWDRNASDFAAEIIAKLGWQDNGTWSVGTIDDREYVITCATSTTTIDFTDEDFVQDVFLSATTYSEIFDKMTEMGYKKLSPEAWSNFVHYSVMPLWQKAAHSTRRPNLAERDAIGELLRVYFDRVATEAA